MKDSKLSLLFFFIGVLGVVFLLALPEIDSNKGEIYITMKHFGTDGKYLHRVSVYYPDKQRLRTVLATEDVGYYESYVNVYYKTNGSEEFYSELDGLLGKLSIISTNVKFVTNDKFNTIIK